MWGYTYGLVPFLEPIRKEINKVSIDAISKFCYLNEFLVPKIALVDGLPFTPKGTREQSLFCYPSLGNLLKWPLPISNAYIPSLLSSIQIWIRYSNSMKNWLLVWRLLIQWTSWEILKGKWSLLLIIYLELGLIWSDCGKVGIDEWQGRTFPS